MEHGSEYGLRVFSDESGQHDLDVDKSGASNLFVCVAIILDGNQLPAADAQMRQISIAHFSGTEVKSRKVGSNHRRRLRVLRDIGLIEFGYYALVIDKARITKDSGLSQKRSFYKFLNRMLYERLARAGCHVHILADEIGGQAFMDSFEPYLASMKLPNLFTQITHAFGNSEDEPLVQLADFVAGSLNYYFDPEKRSEHAPEFRSLLKPKEIGIRGWPPNREFGFGATAPIDADVDSIIRASSINRAMEFIAKHGEDQSDADRRMQAAVLAHLLYLKEYEPDVEQQSVYSDGLIEFLEKQGFRELSKEQFRARVVAPLRDADILIAGTSAGYRLATSVADIEDYVRHTRGIVGPMLGRLCTAREIVKMVTANRHDILESAEHSSLRAVADAYADSDVLESSQS